jgi:phosphoribosyl 1,2-cyclic phosphodiesterase
MRFASLGSGSKGNGMLVEQGKTCVLIDCGFSLKSVEQRLARLEKTLADLSAVIVTHEHSDHIRGVGVLARRTRLPIYMTPGTAAHYPADQRGEEIPGLCYFNSHESFVIDDLELQPFPVPHDAREPSQFVFNNGRHRLGLLTDTGHITRHIESMLDGCDALMLECNYDTDMLEEGPYPETLKRRVGGDQGHLSNVQAAGLLEVLDCSRLQHIVAAHVSEKNNTGDHARQALARALGCAQDWIGLCDQNQGLLWRALD